MLNLVFGRQFGFVKCQLLEGVKEMGRWRVTPLVASFDSPQTSQIRHFAGKNVHVSGQHLRKRAKFVT